MLRTIKFLSKLSFFFVVGGVMSVLNPPKPQGAFPEQELKDMLSLNKASADVPYSQGGYYGEGGYYAESDYGSCGDGCGCGGGGCGCGCGCC